MTALDGGIIVIYMIALAALGALLARQIKTSSDLFAAGEQSPWWLAGVSAYMTMFSSGTFVVWGGIAYRSGMVAVSICTTLGFSALLVAYFVAGRWKASGVSSAAEFIHLRFGPVAVQVYTWLGIVTRMIGVAIALYSISVLVCALVPLSPGAPFRNSETGNLSVNFAIVVAGVVVVGYTMAGGLWSVLVTDVLQFVVLVLSVLLVIPLILAQVGGARGFVQNAPDGFLDLSNAEFPLLFLAGWTIVHALKIGGEWAFVQRFLCVPTRRDAIRAAGLFGVLYLLSPLLWMIPPMAYRLIADDANPEQAYILACRTVLPSGMVGLMLAAMFSATASMADSEINVFAGAVTRDIYGRVFRPDASERHLVAVGRLVTMLLGGVVVVLAIAIPHIGGAEQVIMSITGLFVAPMVLPTIWGLFSRRIGLTSVFVTILLSGVASAMLKFVFNDWAWVQANERLAEVIVGISVPVVVLLFFELTSAAENPGWQRVIASFSLAENKNEAVVSDVPARILIAALFVLSLILLMITILQPKHRLLIGGCAAGLTGLAWLLKFLNRAIGKRQQNREATVE